MVLKKNIFRKNKILTKTKIFPIDKSHKLFTTTSLICLPKHKIPSPPIAIPGNEAHTPSAREYQLAHLDLTDGFQFLGIKPTRNLAIIESAYNNLMGSRNNKHLY